MKTRRMFKAIASFILILCAGHSAWTSRPLDRFDVLIKNTTIVDGTGAPAFKGDIAIKGERIYALGKVSGDAGIVIDGTGLISCPGFIDPHSHGDNGLLKFPAAENLIMQGITTFVGGNCGQSQAPQKGLSFDQYLAMVEKTGISVNFAPLVGHNQIRSLVMGNDFKRKATPEEISRMKEFVEEAMKSGALGLSAGLDYYPGEYAGEEELVPLTKIAGEHGGLFVLHQRHRNSDWPGTPEEWKYGVYHGPIEDVWIGRYRGVWEALEISKKAHVPLHIAHICNIYRIPQPHPEFLEKAVAQATLWNMDRAKEQGYDVTFDVILSVHDVCNVLPIVEEFIRSRTLALEPFRKFSKAEFVERLKTKAFRETIRKIYNDHKLKLSVVNTSADPFWMNRFKVVECKNKEFEGKTIAEIARIRDTDCLEAIFDILVEDPDSRWFQYLDEKEVTPRTIPVFLSHPLAMPSTDEGILPPAAGPEGIEFDGGFATPSDTAYGAFADYIGTYVRGNASLRLEEAVKKATSFPAQRFGLKDRGILKPEAYADLLIFDLAKIKKTGDYMKPAQRPEGIEYVFVNGRIVYKDKAHTGVKAGKVLRHK